MVARTSPTRQPVRTAGIGRTMEAWRYVTHAAGVRAIMAKIFIFPRKDVFVVRHQVIICIFAPSFLYASRYRDDELNDITSLTLLFSYRKVWKTLLETENKKPKSSRFRRGFYSTLILFHGYSRHLR